jgi:hypothetical protein
MFIRSFDGILALTALLITGQKLLLVFGRRHSRFARARARPRGNDILFERFQFLVTISKRWYPVQCTSTDAGYVMA